MADRRKTVAEPRRQRAPIANASPEVVSLSDECIPTGSFNLDLALNGGWGKGRIVNLVGDSSSGKTLLAVEACANLAMMSGAKYIRYIDAEHAFDADYARSLGMPQGIETNDEIATVEQFFADLEDFLKRQNPSRPSLYVVDSLDALSDAGEMERDMSQGSYGAEKAKKLSQLFRRTVGKIEHTNCTLMIISQLRDKIGVTFGERSTRAGGRALQFYCSQVVWLREVDKIRSTIMGEKRVTGIETHARVRKNKMGMPFREATMSIKFGYGVDDCLSMVNWLKERKVASIDNEKLETVARAYEAAMRKGDREEHSRVANILRHAVMDRWMKMEDALAPAMSKYGQ